MFLYSLYFLLLLICKISSQSTKECDRLGITRSEDVKNFIVCTEKDGILIITELSCSNGTIYSGREAKCVPKGFGFINPLSLSTDTEDEAEEKINCITPGLICSTCNRITFCSGDIGDDGETTIKEIGKIDCNVGKHCTMNVGCTDEKTTFCSLGAFKCDDDGIFPDPFDCKAYHICNSGDPLNPHIRRKCTSGAFNSRTSTCGYKLDRDECTSRPVPQCKREMEMGAATSNPNIYYICLRNGADSQVLRPSLHRCLGGREFNVTTLSCN